MSRFLPEVACPGGRRHRMRLPGSLALLTLAFLAPASSRAQLSLGTIVSLAQRNSSTVKLAEADESKAEAILSQSKNVYIPNFVIGSSIGPPSIGFPAGQPSIASGSMQSLFFSYPQRQYIRAAEAGTQAAALSLKDAREQVALDAAQAYIELDAVTSELETARQQAGFSGRLVEIEQQRTDAGVDALSELLQARLTAAQLKLKRIHLESRAKTLASQLAGLTGMPASTILPSHASIPEIPAVSTDAPATSTYAIQSAQSEAQSRQFAARGDELANKIRPQIGFGAQYNRDATSLNNYNLYYGQKGTKFKADNFSAGFSITIPIFDMNHRAKAKQSAAEALRATLEVEQAQRQNDLQIATLTATLRELDALAEIASLKQQIASEQLKTVQTQLETGNGQRSEPGAQPQLSPKSEQLARIDERQKFMDALDARFDLNKTRLALVRALGHMEDWLRTLASRETEKDSDGDTVHPN